MIFSANNERTAGRVINELIEEVEHTGLTRPGDRYLFAALREDDGLFDCRYHRTVGRPTAPTMRLR
jgi:hypothetical protein